MRKTSRTIVAAIIIVCSVLVIAYFSMRPWIASKVPPETIADTYRIEAGTNNQVFHNFVDGYRLTLPSDAEISFGTRQVDTVVTWQDTTLHIIKQKLPSTVSAEHYIAFNTGTTENPAHFRNNVKDHRITHDEATTINNRNAHVMQWERIPIFHLGKVDQQHYTSIDIALSEAEVVTFLFKTSSLQNELQPFLDIATSYASERPSKGAFIPEKRATPEREGLEDVTKEVLTKHFSADAPRTWGIFEPTYAEFDYKTLAALETELDYQFPFIVQYMDFTRSDPVDDVMPVLRQAKKEGRIVELTLQTKNPESGRNQVYDVLSGKHDAYLKKLADAIRFTGAPVILRIGNEMNGDWCDYNALQTSRDPDIFIEFYRYIHKKLTFGNANRYILYCWNPNNQSFPNFTWNNAHRYYPGDEYVDLVGLTAYNTGTYYSSEKWQTFDELYKDTYEDYTAIYSQPMLITEFASSSIGGDKVAWTTDMLQALNNYPAIKVAIWWNHVDYDPADLKTVSRAYTINDPAEMLPLFKNTFASLPKPEKADDSTTQQTQY